MREAVLRAVDDAPTQVLRARIADGMQQEIEFSPTVRNAQKHRLELARDRDIARQDDPTVELFGNRPNMALGFWIHIGDGELGSSRMELAGAPIGDAALIADAK